MISPDKVSFIDRMSDNIADAQMAKSAYAEASAKDQMIGIPGVADYMDTETARVFPKQPSQIELNLNMLPSFQDYQKSDQGQIDRTILNAPDEVLQEISPDALDLKKALQEEYKMENLKNTFGAEQIYGTQGSFFGEPLAKGGRAGFMAGTIPGGYGKQANRYLKEIESDMHKGYQYYKRSGGKKKFKDYMRESMSRYFADGGIAGLSGGVKSGPPPESGPTSEGLPSLMKRGMKI